ncbi:right-handed parallel beta-helix repeat-containing protein [Gynuella sunshinyii]|uniref:Fibronectin type-III domain-containing protein n=1 Tax=Gynuella sunshinyii YC6258 TaxID=1445510 RepID=A0A0C5VW38_9GAMM|nr:DUF4990 domain-containing protein [Gynuella sunshinyii]AJQ97543.1 hypothetical Protein YC6258_05515 [Gynuella sunshinyii YC6258]
MVMKTQHHRSSSIIRHGCLSFALLTATTIASHSQAAANRPDGYTTICKIGETCSVSQATNVAFGAAGEFVYKVLNGTFSCTVATFGSDPIPSKSVKECSIPSDGSSGGGSSDSGDTSAVSLSGQAGDGSVSLSWSDAGTDSTYQVYYDTDSDPSGRVRLASLRSDVHSYTATGLSNGTTYWFWIKYLQSDGTYSNSNAFSATPVASSSGGGTTDPNGIVVDTAAEILSAISSAAPGDVIYVRAGTYYFSSTIELKNNGSSSKKITFSNYPTDNGRPLFDFSSMSESSSNRGFKLSGNYWHVYGIDVRKAGDNGMFISGSNNIVEFSTFYENADTGLQLGNGASNNLIKNVDSYYNADSSLENADGFAAKLDVGTGNKFYGCRAWNNLDDGFDGYLRGANNITTTYENTWAIRNGYMKNGTKGSGDGNGFKTGGSDDKALKHNAVFINTIAAGNIVDGYDHNSNRGSITIYNAIAHQNGRNINFGSTNIAQSLTIKNTISYDGDGSDSLKASSTNISNNSWQSGVSTSSSDFQSLNIDQLLAPRKADGSLPDVSYFHLVRGSDLVNAGVDVGLPYSGSAPDIGAFEAE